MDDDPRRGNGTLSIAAGHTAGGALAAVVPSPNALRDELQRLVEADLLGPAGGKDEEVDEQRVSERYLVGMLAPRNKWTDPGEQDRLAEDGAGTGEDDKADEPELASASLFPSSLGLSLTVDGAATELEVEASWGRYERVKSEYLETREGNPKTVWRRVPVRGVLRLPLAEGAIGSHTVTPEQEDVRLRGVVRRLDDHWRMVTLFLVNNQSEPQINRDTAWLFQAGLAVRAPDGAPIFIKRPLRRDPGKLDPLANAEERALAMVYRHHVEFATGHGVAVRAKTAPGDPTRAVRIATCAIPRYDVPMTAAPTAADNPDLTGLELDMRALAESSTPALLDKLRPLAEAYARWIERQRRRVAAGEDGLTGCEEEAGEALARCERALARLRDGVALLERDPNAADAFRFANRAMWLQRVHTIYAETARTGGRPDMTEIDVAANRSWRPFQLAFLLLNLPAVTDLKHAERNDPTQAIADLLWFPTGGGKTEAYLGLAAYAMGLRRLQGAVGGRLGEYGVAVLMRYTLRVLTLQQFQRASALICACEVIRREAKRAGDNRWGDEPFRIGLWVGQKTTPNRIEDAEEAIKRDHGQGPGPGGGVGTPAQLTNCPWCGSALDPGRDIKAERFERGRARVITYCGDKLGRCEFTQRRSPDEGLPVLVVDEEIYRRLPALLIATVDKFAQMPWNGQTQMLFGQVTGYCPRHGFVGPCIDDRPSHPAKGQHPAVRQVAMNPLRPPDLIIQDELHLISGPLGTLVGLYETAVDELCTWTVDGVRVRPKVIASTATIRQAQDQVGALFMRRVEVFPPQDLDAGDNFFSVQREPGEANPGRRYVGVCAPGHRLKKALIRVYTAYLAAGQYLYDRYGTAADPWMTAVGYFNSIRELGGMRRLVEDDVRTALQRMDERGLARRPPPRLEELTSRISAREIPVLLDDMEVRFDPAAEAERKARRKAGQRTDLKAPIDVLLATNMISVGVDVKRLGLMIVAGQPKTTAEYIQATSRVGRSTPGVVCTVYNWARPRDLSHYEQFEHYHATFYKHVEGLSVTPFAARALDRGLSGVFVGLVRDMAPDFNPNEAAGRLDRSHPVVGAAMRAIVERARNLRGHDAAEEVRRMLDKRVDHWLNQAQVRDGGIRLVYRADRSGTSKPLLEPAGLGDWQTFTCLNSLRDVEPTVGLILDTLPIDDGRIATDAEVPDATPA